MTERVWFYRLDGHEPVVEPDIHAWAEWLLATDRIVGSERIRKAHVSTVFLGLDHNWSGGGDPILFETVIFGPDYLNVIGRYRTWDEAEAGHANVVRELKGLPK